MFEVQPTQYPAGSAREVVALMLAGNLFFDGNGLRADRDSRVMRTCELLREAGARPAERVRLYERREAIERGEALA